MKSRSLTIGLYFSAFASFFGSASCAREPEITLPPPTMARLVPTPREARPEHHDYVPMTPRFENPGGMWMPNQMGEHAAKLKELGLQFDPKELEDPTSDVLSAIIFLGGCSASFVSPEGLVITNHHCAVGALQYNSNPQKNYLQDGFLAKNKSDERSNGPSARALVTQKVTDVTAKVFDRKSPLSAALQDRARYKLIEKNEKAIVTECEKNRPGIKCTVASFYEGASYYLIEQLEIRDLRLVYAPPAGVGNYGGEIDNWQWPRHSGDVSIFRAYVGKDGLPADYSTDNVPYKPAHILKLASKPLEEGDLVFVAGYPGRTHSLKNRVEVEDYVSFTYPRIQKLCEDGLAAMEKITDKDDKIRANPVVRRFGNQLTNVKGQLEGLTKAGVLQVKIDREASLIKFIDADPARKAKYGAVLSDIDKAYAEQKKHEESSFELKTEFLLPKLVNAAYAIVRMAEERAKPDADRDPDYQERNLSRLVDTQNALENQYSRAVDLALLNLALDHSKNADPKDRADVDAILTKLALTPAALFEKTELEKTETRVELLKKATLADLQKSTDPLIRFALALRPKIKEVDERDEALKGRMALLKPLYVDALRAFVGHDIAPDANATLRISYGTVRGYSPKPGAPVYRPFTVLSEVVRKNTGAEPFNAPLNLLDTSAERKFGPYVDAKLGEVPVDFLADLHITGGNSGSATLNAKGEITGLAFDGNYESLSSDWLFRPEITRSIHVDIRYVMWLLDEVEGASALVTELGGKSHAQ